MRQVSMVLTDMHGKTLRFEDTAATAAFELHIKPVV